MHHIIMMTLTHSTIAVHLQRPVDIYFIWIVLIFPGKSGADVLFLDPARKSTTVGVTVSPVRITSLESFGDVAAVGKRLLDAERAKVLSILSLDNI